MVEQQLKKRTEDKLVLGCFFNLGFALSAVCGLKRYRKVKKGMARDGKVK